MTREVCEHNWPTDLCCPKCTAKSKTPKTEHFLSLIAEGTPEDRCKLLADFARELEKQLYEAMRGEK